MTHETKIVWHDLTEDPNDLPTEKGWYTVSIHVKNDIDYRYVTEARFGLYAVSHHEPIWNEYVEAEDALINYPNEYSEIVAWAEQIKPYVPQGVSYAGNQ